MTIDTTKPWYPQDYTLDEVIALSEEQANKSSLLDVRRDHVSNAKEDYRIRKGGPAGVFVDLRRHLRQALHGKQIHQMPKYDRPQKWRQSDENGCFTVNEESFMKTVDEAIGLALIKLDSSTICDARFTILENAVPVLTNADVNPLLHESRPCTDILSQYWEAVSQEDKITD